MRSQKLRNKFQLTIIIIITIINGTLWCSVVLCGSLWCCVVLCGALWCFVVICGVLWCSVVLCGALCCSVVLCGAVWIVSAHWLPSSLLRMLVPNDPGWKSLRNQFEISWK
jgi:hypothetical protein